MGASEQERVNSSRAHRCQEPLGEHGDLVTGGLTSFDELDEAGTGRARQLDVHAEDGRDIGDRGRVGT